MATITVKDFNNLDYTQIGAGVGAVGGIIWSMKSRYGLGKTAVITLALGAIGAYIGYQYQNHFQS